MTIAQKISYIKGLAEGLALDTETKEGKVLTAIIDLLDDMVDEIDAIDEACAELGEQLDAVDEDLSAIEDDFYADEDDYDEEEDDEEENYGGYISDEAIDFFAEDNDDL